MKLKQEKFFGIDLMKYDMDKIIELRSEEVLVFGSSDGIYFVNSDGIYVFDGNSIKKIAERDDRVYALEVWGKQLYDAGSYGTIRRTMDGKVIAKRDNWVEGLKALEGELYGLAGSKIYKKTMYDKVIAERDSRITALEIWKKKLHYATYEGLVRRAVDNQIAVDFKWPFQAVFGGDVAYSREAIYSMRAVPKFVLRGVI